MLSRTGALALSLSFVASCGPKQEPEPVVSPAPPPPVAAPKPVEPEKPAPTTKAIAPPEKVPIAVEETLTLASGATFRVPVGWTMDTANAFLVLESPEHDIRMAVGDVQGASTADDAVMKVWHAFDPNWSRPLRLAQERPPRKGWDERKVFSYEVSPNEKRVVTAIALRRAQQWTVFAMDGDMGGFEKRAGQIQLVGDSLRPAGYSRESFAGKTARELDADAIAKIKTVVDEARLAADVPGVALALVQNGKVVYAGGLGVRSLNKKAPVNEHTLFMIASNTKALTTFMLAKLVDEGRFGWDTPVTQLSSRFALGSPEITKQVLVKHLVCACTGLPRQDLEWLLEFDKQTPAGVMKLLSTMQPTSRFGEVFQYSNLMAAAAGYVGGSVVFPRNDLGSAYDAAMQTRVFGPLGMRETTFDFTRALAANHATPHGTDIDGRVQNAALDLDYAIEAARPAGGAWSNVGDLAKYIMVEIAKGKLPDGKQHISEANILARQVPQIEVGEDLTYGMGLFVDQQYGTPVVRHGGDLIGYHSDMFWLPEHNVGGVILTNADNGVLLRRAFIRRTLEVLFDGRAEASEDVLTAINQLKERLAKERQRVTVPPNPDEVAKLASRYTSPELGNITVIKGKSGVVFDFGEFHSAVASRMNDDGSLSFLTVDPGQDGFELVMSEKGGKRALIMRDAQHEYVFYAR